MVVKALAGFDVVVSGALLPARGARQAGLELTTFVFLCLS